MRLFFLPVNSAVKSYFRRHFFTWRKKFGGLEVPEVKQLKSLEEENTRLRKLLAEAMLAREALQMTLIRKFWQLIKNMKSCKSSVRFQVFSTVVPAG